MRGGSCSRREQKFRVPEAREALAWRSCGVGRGPGGARRGGPWSLSTEPEMVSKQGGAGTHCYLRESRRGRCGVGIQGRERMVDSRLGGG